MTYYPIPAFHFAVTIFDAIPSPVRRTLVDAGFQEVTGLNAEQTFEEVVEGGENRFVHRLPKQTKYGNLVLKRGLINASSELAMWFGSVFDAGLAVPIEPKNLEVQLLNEDGAPVFVWAIYGAYPAKWDLAPMKSTENDILIETLELAFTFFERRNGVTEVAERLARKLAKA